MAYGVLENSHSDAICCDKKLERSFFLTLNSSSFLNELSVCTIVWQVHNTIMTEGITVYLFYFYVFLFCLIVSSLAKQKIF